MASRILLAGERFPQSCRKGAYRATVSKSSGSLAMVSRIGDRDRVKWHCRRKRGQAVDLGAEGGGPSIAARERPTVGEPPARRAQR
jgi:hypothetical protein